MTDLPAADLLYAMLPAGRDRAEPLGSLAERLNWPRRKVERAVRDLRLAGKPICTTHIGNQQKGVWVSRDPDEVERCAVALIDEHLAPVRKTSDALMATARAMRGAQVEQLSWMDAA